MGVRGIAWLLFLGYLLAAAIQDFREKQVKIWVFVLFGFLGLITAGKNLGWQEHLKSSCLGLGLLGLGKVSRRRRTVFFDQRVFTELLGKYDDAMRGSHAVWIVCRDTICMASDAQR